MKGCRAVNLGQPEMYDFEWVMDTMHKNNCVYFGHWPKYEGEDTKAYISRMKKASAGGTRNLLLHFNENLFPEMCESEIYDIWNR